MEKQKTLALIKPDAVAGKRAGLIIAEIEKNNFTICAMKKIHLTKKQAQGFYAVHTGKPFFNSLVDFMTEGPIIAMILEKENAVAEWRRVMGATDPSKADNGTIRKMFGASIERNATHGSDAVETADFETGYYFNAMEVM